MLIRSPELEGLCFELAQMQPDWDEIVKEYKLNPNFDENKEVSIERYRQLFHEIKLKIDLKEKHKTNKKITLEPFLRLPVESDKYFVKRCYNGNVTFYNKSDKVSVAEYDNFIKYYDRNVVFEIALKQWSYTQNILLPNRMCKKILPFTDFVNEFPSYVAIICKENFRKQSEIITNFRNANGILVPFYTDRITYNQKVDEVVNDYKLPLKIPKNNIKSKNDELELEDIVL